MSTKGKHEAVVGLDLLRSAAALLVCLYHYGFTAHAHPETPLHRAMSDAAPFSSIEPFARASFVGVEIFFVISGFVIAFTANGRPAGRFLQGRIERLLPAAWVCATITLVCLVATGNPLDDSGYVRPYLRSLLMIPRAPWIDSVYWTLAVEIVFYAIVLALIAARRLHWLAIVMGTVGGLSTALGLYMVLRPQPVLDLHPWLIFNFIKNGAAFATGCFLWLALQDPAKFRSRLALAGLFAIGAALEIHASTFIDPMNQHPWQAVMLFGVLFAVLVAAIFTNEFWLRHTSPRARTVVRLLGISTYPFYLLHNFAGATLLGALVREAGLDDTVAALLTIATVMATSILIASVIEPRLRGVMRSLLGAIKLR
ncbi:acyltransferase [soil metagenome]